MGRPTLLTQEIQDKLCTLIAQGLPKERACWLVGISDVSMYTWVQKGQEDPDSAYGAFASALKKAEAEATLYFYDQIKAGKAGEWQKWARIWEGLQPSVFARRIEVSGDPDKPIPLTFTGVEKSS